MVSATNISKVGQREHGRPVVGAGDVACIIPLRAGNTSLVVPDGELDGGDPARIVDIIRAYGKQLTYRIVRSERCRSRRRIIFSHKRRNAVGIFCGISIYGACDTIGHGAHIAVFLHGGQIAGICHKSGFYKNRGNAGIFCKMIIAVVKLNTTLGRIARLLERTV